MLITVWQRLFFFKKKSPGAICQSPQSERDGLWRRPQPTGEADDVVRVLAKALPSEALNSAEDGETVFGALMGAHHNRKVLPIARLLLEAAQPAPASLALGFWGIMIVTCDE